jgi:hypothetical protein
VLDFLDLLVSVGRRFEVTDLATHPLQIFVYLVHVGPVGVKKDFFIFFYHTECFLLVIVNVLVQRGVHRSNQPRFDRLLRLGARLVPIAVRVRVIRIDAHILQLGVKLFHESLGLLRANLT